MKMAFVAVLALMFGGLIQGADAEIITFDFSSEPDASIKFLGGTEPKIEFPNQGLYDFTVSQTGATSLGGLHGNISGTFAIGSITVPMNGIEEASVTTTDGTFSVRDAAGEWLTANLDWKNISIANSLFGVMNLIGEANLTQINYSGTNGELIGIRNGADQTVTLTFQFASATRHSLTQLVEDGQETSTSYSGSVSSVSVPEPSTVAMLGAAGLALLAWRWRRNNG